jgi:hypothetical protein
MTFSNPCIQDNEPSSQLKDRLERLGAREIGLWKEMVLQDESLFPQIYHCMFSNHPKLAWHSAWVIDHVSEVKPQLLEPLLPDLIGHLPGLKNSSLKRHFTRMLLSQKIPENQMGTLVDLLYDLLSPAEPVAVRANAMQLLYNISLIEPDLQPELISVTESILEEDLTPGLLSKSKKILSRLKR